MSGAEHIDIASAQCKGINDFEPTGEKELCNLGSVESGPGLFSDSPGDRISGYENNALGEQGVFGGDITNWDVGKSFGKGLNPVGEVLGMLDSDFQGCEPSGMGNSVLNNNAAQGPENGVGDGNGVAEQLNVGGGENVTGELAEGGEVKISGNVETLGSSLSTMPQLGGGARGLDGNKEETQGIKFGHGKSGNQINEPVGDDVWASVCEVAKLTEESVSLMLSASEHQTLCHEGQTCEPFVLQGTGAECAKNELADPSVTLPISVSHELVSESLARRELDLQNGSLKHGAEFSCPLPGRCEQSLSPNHLLGENQDGLGCQSSHTQLLKIDTQFQNDPTAKEDPVHDSSKNDNVILDDMLNKPVHISNVVPDCTSSRIRDNLRFEQAADDQGGGTSTCIEQTEKKEVASEAEPDYTKEEHNADSKVDMVESSPSYGAKISVSEQVEMPHHDMAKSSGIIDEIKPVACDEKASPEQSRPFPKAVDENMHVVVLACPAINGSEKPHRGRTGKKTLATLAKDSSEKRSRGRPPQKTLATPANDASGKPCRDRRPMKTLASPANDSNGKPRRGRRPGNTSAISMEKSDPHQSSGGSTRALRSRSRENSIAPEPSANMKNSRGSTAGGRGRKKRPEVKGKSHDEFSKMRKHLRYLLHRIRYEQNLLDAYSSEGWRGQSIEKLRPEKELERAKADINRSKVKIRDLFQRLDSMSSEGKFPDCLYDSEGLIDSEDIFCAKCGSKDLSTDNDILLCDGVCDRGFHQHCLEPPLRTEEIPPDDDGWLCPACDCKVDCIDLLNDSQGTKLSIEDNWEKIFPEALAAMAGHEQDGVMGLPSDDSEDNDYNPDGPDDDVKVEGTEASSDQSDSDESDSSDCSFVSEDLGHVRGNEQYLGLPSDDSEDNDYDPDAANVNEEDKCQSSSSDFTSASEDLGATVGDDGTSDKEELSLPLGLEQDLGDSALLSGRRHVERLDYKKLYDETYKNASSDSGDDDEEWTDMVATKKRKSSAEKDVPASANGDALVSADGVCPDGTPRRGGRPKLNCQAANISPAQLQKTSQETSSSGKGRKRPPYNKLGEAVTQRLYESFKENQYPDRSRKAKLAEELGLTPARVDKWFGNARWSLNHHPTRIEATISRVVPHSITPQSVACNGVESASAIHATTVPECGNAVQTKLDSKGNVGNISTPRTRKRKKKDDDEPMFQTSKAETSKESTQADQLQTPVEMETRNENTIADPLPTPEAQGGRVQRKRRKSGA